MLNRLRTAFNRALFINRFVPDVFTGIGRGQRHRFGVSQSGFFKEGASANRKKDIQSKQELLRRIMEKVNFVLSGLEL